MTKAEYIQNPDVRGFVSWLSEKLDAEDSLSHSYLMKRPRGLKWSCNSLYDAYKNYKWGFKCQLPSGELLAGSEYGESAAALSLISKGLARSLEAENTKDTAAYCLSVLSWGGVLPKNREKVEALGSEIVSYFRHTKTVVSSRESSLKHDFDGIIMNSGFTKLYSLIYDDFIIYDGRVGAALGMLVRMYLEEKNRKEIPAVLRFAYGDAREANYNADVKNRRDPGNEVYKFPKLTNNPVLHCENNLRANWLLKEVIESRRSRFSALRDPLRALEASLFMVGYDVRSQFEGADM